MDDLDRDPDAILAQFNRLMTELIRGEIQRNTFRPWEVQLLLDVQSCQLRPAKRRATLTRYQRAVQRAMENGAAAKPFKLSEFLKGYRAQIPPAAPPAAAPEEPKPGEPPQPGTPAWYPGKQESAKE